MKRILKKMAAVATAAAITVSLTGCGLFVDKKDWDDVKIAKSTVLTIGDDIEVSGAYYGYYYASVYNEMYSELAAAQQEELAAQDAVEPEVSSDAIVESDAVVASDAAAVSDAVEVAPEAEEPVEAPEIVVDDKEVRKEVNKRISAVKLAAQKAKDAGKELDADDNKAIADMQDSFEQYIKYVAQQSGIAIGGATGVSYNEFLETAYLTNSEAVKDVIEDIYMASCYYNEIVSDEYVTVKHILVKGSDEAVPGEETVEEPSADSSGNPVEEAPAEEEKTLTKAEALAKITEVKARIDGGEDFDAVMNEVSEDGRDEEGKLLSIDGYTFTKGEMVQAFEETAFALEENVISDPVETEYGYHLIKKLPLNASEIPQTLASAMLLGTLAENTKALIDAEADKLSGSVKVKEDKSVSHYKFDK